MSTKKKRPESLPADTSTPDPVLKVSFALIDLDGDKDFSPERCQELKQLRWLLEHLRELCTLTFNELQFEKRRRFDFHSHEWQRTARKNGFQSVRHLSEEHLALKSYQVAVGYKARLHGLFIDSVFYPIWIDPEHRLYAS